MAQYPNAEQRPWYPYNPERWITPTTIIVHTNAVNAEDPGSQGGLSWHFQVGQYGVVYQHRDTNTRAAANANANGFAISIETWDGGDPEGNPWNVAQMNALVALIAWCCDTHNIPRIKVQRWDGRGIGYHRMYGEWNQPVHSCPGNTRAAQFDNELLPRLQTPTPAPTPTPQQEFDMTPGQCRDRIGRKWFFVVGDDRAMYASVNGGTFFTIGGVWTSGLDARCEDDGLLVVAGRGSDGALWQAIIYTDGGPVPPHGQKIVFNYLGGHIYPPA